MKGDQREDSRPSADIKNILLLAFGRIFDIVLYPDLNNISRNEEKQGYHDVSTIFYHGHLKGRKGDTDVSVTYNNMEVVRKNKYIVINPSVNIIQNITIVNVLNKHSFSTFKIILQYSLPVEIQKRQCLPTFMSSKISINVIAS